MIERLNMADPVVAGQVWRLQHAAFAAEWREIGGSGLMPLADTIRDLQESGETFFGICESGEPVAAASCLTQGDTVLLRRLMVRPDRFRRGLATLLLRHVEREYCGMAQIEAFAAAANLPAVRLYESAGYRDCGEFQGPFGIGMKRYRKRLSPRENPGDDKKQDT